MGAQAGATFAHVPVSDGFELKFGKASIRVLETPGHTPESICLVVTDYEKSGRALGGADRRHVYSLAMWGGLICRHGIRRRNWQDCCTTACMTS